MRINLTLLALMSTPLLILLTSCSVGDEVDGELGYSNEMAYPTYKGEWSYSGWGELSSLAGNDNEIKESSTLTFDPNTGMYTIAPMPTRILLAIGGKSGLTVVSAEPYVMNCYQKGYNSSNSILGVAQQGYEFRFLEGQKVRTMHVDFRENSEIFINRYTGNVVVTLEVLAISIDGEPQDMVTGGILTFQAEE